MTQSVCQDTPHCYYTFITSRHDWPVQLEQQPHTFPHQPLFHRCSLSNIQCQQLQCQGGQFVCFQWPLRIKRGIWTNSPLGQRGWNNHHTLHGGNHLMLKPLDPLIPEAKLSHTVITSAPFLLLDLQCVCVCVCVWNEALLKALPLTDRRCDYERRNMPLLWGCLLLLCMLDPITKLVLSTQ